MGTLTASDMQASVVNLLNSPISTPITIQYWNTGSVFFNTGSYDVGYYNTGSANVVSGLGVLQPMGRGDASFIHQGRLQQDDVVLYFTGSIIVDSNARITVGNTGSVYDVVPDIMVQRWDISGTTIYQKAYLRTRTTQTP